MPRTTQRNYTAALERQGADSTPGPKLSDDVQLVQIIDDSRDLLSPIDAVGGVSGAVVPPQGAGNEGGIRLIAPSTRTLLVRVIRSEDAASSLVIGFPNLAVAWTSAGAALRLGFGGPAPTQLLATVDTGFVPLPSFVGGSFLLLPGAELAADLVVRPGQILQAVGNVANLQQSVFLNWVEVGG